jgi:hypothetical protein
MTDHTRRLEPDQGLLEITAPEVVAATRELLQNVVQSLASPKTCD